MKIIIVGSGLLGLSTAYYLAQANHSVTVLERKKGIALETSFANASLLTTSLAAPFTSRRRIMEMVRSLWSSQSTLQVNPCFLPSICRWGLHSLRSINKRQFQEGLRANIALVKQNERLIQQILASEKSNDFDYDNVGTLTIFRDNKALQYAIEDEKQLLDFNLSSEPLAPDGVTAIEPATTEIKDQLAGGIYHKGDSHGDPYKFCQLLEKRCLEMGVEFRFGVDIKTARKKGRFITSLNTGEASYRADAYVIAAGSFSSRLLSNTSVSIPVYPVKGYSITIDVSGWTDAPKVPLVDGDSHVAVTPLGQRLRIAGFAEFAGYKQEIPASRIEELSYRTKQIYPALPARCFTNGMTPWCGLRPLTCDGVPIVGRSSEHNLFLNTGHGQLGWSMSAASGKAIAELISDQQLSVDLEPYSPLRFN